MKSNGFLREADRLAWFNFLKISESASLEQQIQAAINAGDAVMYRLYQHVKSDGGHIAEQSVDHSTLALDAHHNQIGLLFMKHIFQITGQYPGTE